MGKILKDEAVVNNDLIKERRKCSFDVQELIHFIDGGEEITKQRKVIENTVLSIKELRDEVPEEYLSHKERYENAVRKSAILYQALAEHIPMLESIEAYKPSHVFKVQEGVIKDISPFLLHMGMFLPTIVSQANEEQLNEYLPKAFSMQIIGAYAQTELGHGTNLKCLETTATYDPHTEEFVLNCPTLSAYKWWPGGLGQTANYCIVVAQLYTKGVCYGVHAFVIQIRDTETHVPLPGVKVGEIGPKLGFSTANNGFLGFDNYRVPRSTMLMKNAQVLKDGTYVKAKNEKLAYGTMVLIRVMIVADLSYELARASTIAIRYSAVRHQSQPKPNEPEPQIIDYVTQQHKIFPALATSHALRTAGNWLWDQYSKLLKDMSKGNTEELPELHALACCLKAVSSLDASAAAEMCRLACGGHGYMISSHLPTIYGIITATVTYEGEYTVMLLQTARYLVKAWKQALEGNTMTPTVAYMLDFVAGKIYPWDNTPEAVIKGLQAVAAGKVKDACEALDRHVRAGASYEDAWNLASILLTKASEAHCRAVLCNVYWSETQRLTSSLSPRLRQVLLQLAELYVTYWGLEKIGDLLVFSTLSGQGIAALQKRYEELLALIRPNAVGLVDGFDIRDEVLCSTLGAYDGRVYERLMEEALKSPLNKEPVNKSFEKYIKPMSQASKL